MTDTFTLWQHWSERVDELMETEWEMPSESVRGSVQILLAVRLFRQGETPEQAKEELDAVSND